MPDLVSGSTEKSFDKARYVLEFEVTGTPPTLNTYLRMFHMKRHAENNRWYESIHYTLLSQKLPKPEKPLSYFKLSFTRYAARMLDYDNLVASFKPVCDGLKKAGLIADDRWDMTGPWEVTQEKCNSSIARVKIKIEDLT